MTSLERALGVLENLIGKPIPLPKATRVISRYISHIVPNTEDMTDEQKADVFIDSLVTLLKNHNASSAIGEAQRNNKNAEDTARNNSEKDFD